MPRPAEANQAMPNVQSGSVILIRALKADGHAYRWWEETVELVDQEKLMTIAGPGKEVRGPSGGWTTKYVSRTYYWFDRPYVLAEIYYPSGELLEVYVHISSPSRLDRGVLTYTDHELDVVLKPGRAPEVVDEDEFAAATLAYGYTPELQATCRAAVADVLKLIVDWEPAGLPGQSDRETPPHRKP